MRTGWAARSGQVSQVEFDGQTDGHLVASVQPSLVPRVSALARVEGSRNVRRGRRASSVVRRYFLGSVPVGIRQPFAVVSDLESITRGGSGPPAALRANGATATVRQDFAAPHYVRFIVADRPGIIAALAEVFSRHGINVDSVLQEPGWSKDELPFVMTLDSCSSVAVEAGVERIRVVRLSCTPTAVDACADVRSTYELLHWFTVPLCARRPSPPEALYVCDKCLGPLEATYDADAIRAQISRELIASRRPNLWRYREFLADCGRASHRV